MNLLENEAGFFRHALDLYAVNDPVNDGERREDSLRQQATASRQQTIESTNATSRSRWASQALICDREADRQHAVNQSTRLLEDAAALTAKQVITAESARAQALQSRIGGIMPYISLGQVVRQVQHGSARSGDRENSCTISPADSGGKAYDERLPIGSFLLQASYCSSTSAHDELLTQATAILLDCIDIFGVIVDLPERIGSWPVVDPHYWRRSLTDSLLGMQNGRKGYRSALAALTLRKSRHYNVADVLVTTEQQLRALQGVGDGMIDTIKEYLEDLSSE